MNDIDLDVNGRSLIAGRFSDGGDETFASVHPRTGGTGPEFYEATGQQVSLAVSAASAAFADLCSWSPAQIATLLDNCADSVDDHRRALVEAADAETGLGANPRLHGEVDRTVGQWRSFAKMVRSGWHLEAMIDHADDTHPDVRRMLVPIGPVAVFGASNFPLAFSVPGGDTASALAAGCPVVVKGHPAHPITSEIAGVALSKAVEEAGAPAGTFSLIQGSGVAVGEALVTEPGIAAVGFTGSLRGGRSLHDLAASRENPIPVFAEMGSLNPVFVTEQALESRAEAIAEGLVGSITLGTGQFCTKPGLVFIPPSWVERFSRLVAERLASIGPAPMLTPAIRDAFVARVDGSASLEGVSQMVLPNPDGVEGISCAPALLSTDLDRFLSHDDLIEEHFGPMTILVATPGNRIDEAIAGLPGSLTVTVHGEQADIDELGETYRDLTQIAGRVIWNGFPTGVAVVPSMHHGGPYPSTTNSQHTSVGMTAVRRFLRPVAFQGAPNELLPPGLRDDNPWGLRRLVDWAWE